MNNSNSNIKLYLPFNGKDGATSATDYSNSGHSVTFNGNAKISKDQFYNPDVQSSCYFDGTTNTKVDIADSPDWDLGGLFTIDVNFYIISGTNEPIIARGTYGYGDSFYLRTLTDAINFYVSSSGDYIEMQSPAGSFKLNTWYNVRITCRPTGSNYQYKMFIDGKLVVNTVSNVLYPDDNEALHIGMMSSYTDRYLNGYISDVIVVKDEAWDEYAFNNSRSGHLVTANGDAKITTAITDPFGENDGVSSFDGTGDYISVDDSDDWYFPGDFTIDTWVRFTNLSAPDAIAGQRQDGSNYFRLTRANNAGGQLFCDYVTASGSLYFHCTFVANINQWYHIEVVRNGNTWYIFIDGVSQSLTLDLGSWSATLGNISGPFTVGADFQYTEYLTGYIGEFGVSKGIARHTSNFTPSTTREVADEYTALLLPMTGENNATYFPDSGIKMHVELNDYEKYHVASYPLTEVSGDAIDVIGGNNLTDINSVGSADNFRGELARDFENDNSEYFQKSSGFSRNAVTMLSSEWIKIESVPSFAFLLGETGSDINHSRWVLCIVSNRLELSMRDTVSGTFKTATSTNKFSYGVWYNVITFIDTMNDKLYAYVNNEKWIDSSQSMSNFHDSDSASGFVLGKHPINSPFYAYPFDGLMNYLDIYKDISFINDTERESFVQTLYNNGRANIVELSQKRKPKFNNETLDSKREFLVSGWPLNEQSKTRYDLVGRNHLQDNNSVGYVNDATFGDVADFNGTDQYLSESDFVALGTEDFTISIWSNQDTFVDTQKMFCGIGEYSNFSFGRLRSGLSGYVYFDIGGYQGSTYTYDSINTWEHFVLVRNGTTVKIYSNGDLKATKTGISSSISSAELVVGCQIVSTVKDSFFDGKITKLLIYKGYGADQTFVDALYNEGASRMITEASTYVPAKSHSQRYEEPELDSYKNYHKAGWRLNEMEGVRYDNVGNNHLTDNNSVGYINDSQLGKVANFNRSNSEYFSIVSGLSDDLKPSDEFCISVWVKIGTSPATSEQYYITESWDGSADNGWQLSYQNTGGVYKLRCLIQQTDLTAIGNHAAPTNYTLTPGMWYHIIFRGDGSDLYLDVNTSNIWTASYDGTVYASNDRFYIGYSGIASSHCWDGSIASFNFYNGSGLSANAINNLYKQGQVETLKYNSDINRPYPAEHLIDVWPLNESSGNRLSAKNSYVAVDNNTVGSSTGVGRTTCADFVRANSEYLSIAATEYDLSELFATKMLTLGIWFKTSTSGSTLTLISNYGSPVNGIRIYQQDTDSKIYIDFANANVVTNSLNSNTTYNDGLWHRLILTVSNDSVSMYIDGQLEASEITAGAIGDNGTDVYIGSETASGGYYNGQLQDFTVFDTPIDKTFIENDYNNGNGRFY